MIRYIILFILLGFNQTVKSQHDVLSCIADRYFKEYKILGIAISVIKTDTTYDGVSY